MIIIGLLAGAIAMNFIGEAINELKFVEAIHKKTRDLKHKKIWQYGIFFILVVLEVLVVGPYDIHDLAQGAILGSLLGVVNFIFEDSLYDRARNTLR